MKNFLVGLILLGCGASLMAQDVSDPCAQEHAQYQKNKTAAHLSALKKCLRESQSPALREQDPCAPAVQEKLAAYKARKAADVRFEVADKALLACRNSMKVASPVKAPVRHGSGHGPVLHCAGGDVCSKPSTTWSSGRDYYCCTPEEAASKRGGI